MGKSIPIVKLTKANNQPSFLLIEQTTALDRAIRTPGLVTRIAVAANVHIRVRAAKVFTQVENQISLRIKVS